ncbi:MAG: (2Fe-2S) ferredoxin domain-containing protein, partial [Proteobacteria bacterium]|nr:(2Fe-2S) ferredoxin domain-containing protein [Pseudomonadota bacterium]
MMSKIKSFDELKSVQERLKAGRDPKKPCITICVGTGCLAYGTRKLVDNFREELAKRDLAGKIDFRTSGCHGFCERGPMVVISPEKIFYQRVGLADAGEIIDKTLLKGEVIDRLLYIDPATG